LLLIGIGILGIIVINFIDAANFLQIKTIKLFPTSGIAFFFYRFLLAVIILLPATFSIGLSIPLMNKIIAKKGDVGREIALAYGINTLGSVVGCLWVGCILIPRIGIDKTLYLSGAINILSGIILFAISQQKVFSVDNYVAMPIGREKVRLSKTDGILIILYFLSSLLSLGYEVTWFRILGIINTNTILTFTLGLTVYLAGFSFGSLCLYPLANRKINSKSVLSLANWFCGIMTLLLIPSYYSLTEVRNRIIAAGSKLSGAVSLPLIFKSELIVSFIMIFLPTVFLGVIYPAVCDILIKDRKEIVSKTGLIFFVGCMASAIGAIVFNVIIIPSFNLAGSLAFLIISSVIISWAVSYMFRKDIHSLFKLATALFGFVAIFSAVLCGLAQFPFVREQADLKKKNGTFIIETSAQKKAQLPIEKILLGYKAGATATVSVVKQDILGATARKVLYVDGYNVAATDFNSKMDAKMLAHLPLALHPNPKSALTVGYGSGGTSWAMTRYGINVDCIEIESRVIGFSALFYEQNYDVLKKKNFKYIINDARNYLLVTDKKYDVISTDVTNLAYKQNSNLYTYEYFNLMKNRLNEGGIACAWVPITGVNNYEFKVLLKTFQAAFPHTSVWYMGTQYAILIATPKELRIDYSRLKNLFLQEEIKKDLAEVRISTPITLVTYFLFDEAEVREYSKDVPINKDYNPVLEFFSVPTFYDQRLEAKELWRSSKSDKSEYIINIEETDLMELLKVLMPRIVNQM